MRGIWVYSIWAAEPEESEGGAGWLLWMLVLLPLEILLIRWFVQRRMGQNRGPAWSSEQRRATARGKWQAPIELAPEPGTKAEEAGALSPGDKEDDFRKLEGIGPKVNELLHRAGIRTYDQLAAQTEERLRAILREANLPMINPSTWPQQAKAAAIGKEQGQ